MLSSRDTSPLDPANRLGLNYRHEAAHLPWPGPIWDVHTHINDAQAARLYLQVAQLYGIEKIWSMTQLEQLDEVRDVLGERVEFIAVPNYAKKMEEGTFTTQWHERIEAFAARGVRICKFWGAPRGRDLHPALRLDHPLRRQSMQLARSLGMFFMVHVADPDTWFASHYSDATRYGTKAEHYQPLEALLEEFAPVPFLAAHMAGDPEHLDHLQDLLNRHPNLYLDCSATKWMVRELSKQPAAFRLFCQANPGRVLFGSDIVAGRADMSFDLFASRYWALRTLLETDYDGPSPIVDPDLNLVDPTVPADATAHLRGCRLDPATLELIYHRAAQDLLAGWVSQR